MQNDKLLTIVTPAYNRRNLLPRLYESLLRQTMKNFIWLLVDDGSCDGTGELVEQWQQEKKIEISYIYQQNGGKHTALNRGIQETKTPLLFIVDSDDWLTDDAVETINRYYEAYGKPGDSSCEKGKGLCGFSFLRVDSHGMVNEGEFPEDNKLSTYREERINAGLLGDKAEVYVTDILRKYPFPVFPKEKFVPEDAIWIQISGPHPMIHANRRIYVCDYLEGGLTRTGRKMKIYSPFGMMYRSARYLEDKEIRLSVRGKMMLLYQIYSHFAVKRKEDGVIDVKEYETSMEKCGIRHGMMYLLTLLPGKVLFLIWNRKYAQGGTE